MSVYVWFLLYVEVGSFLKYGYFKVPKITIKRKKKKKKEKRKCYIKKGWLKILQCI